MRHGGTALHHVHVLLVRHRERAAPNLASLVQLQLIVHEADVQRPLMRVEPRVLHGQHPGDFVGLVVVRVPPPGRGDEDAAGDPVAPDRVDDIPVGVDLLTHQGVDVGRGGDGEVERDAVVPVRALHSLGGDGVEQGPEDVG